MATTDKIGESTEYEAGKEEDKSSRPRNGGISVCLRRRGEMEEWEGRGIYAWVPQRRDDQIWRDFFSFV